jgi:predicted  nucleic acid-binding Zn-ribbon protein
MFRRSLDGQQIASCVCQTKLVIRKSALRAEEHPVIATVQLIRQSHVQWALPMHPDLERVIALQRLDSAAHDAQRRLADEPERARALDARLEAARQRVSSARERLTENQNARRAIEKDVAVHQGRLSKFRDQAMAVKTNQEYHAIQKEIGFAQTEIKALEDRILERMLEADDLSTSVKRAEADLPAEQKAIESDRKAMAAESAELKALLDRITSERAAIVAAIDPEVLKIFDLVSKRRNGIAVAEARDGICTICHVRLRPQVFNTVRRNEAITQCESCHRILYFGAAPAALSSDNVTQSAR